MKNAPDHSIHGSIGVATIRSNLYYKESIAVKMTTLAKTAFKKPTFY